MFRAHRVALDHDLQRHGAQHAILLKANLAAARVTALHHEAVVALDLHAVVEAAQDQVQEVAAAHGRVVAVENHAQRGGLHLWRARAGAPVLQLEVEHNLRAALQQRQRVIWRGYGEREACKGLVRCGRRRRRHGGAPSTIASSMADT